MASIPLAAIGVKIGYAVEETAGTKPTTGYTHIPDIKSTPSLNTTPNTADATTFDNKEFTTYVELLKDLGGALEFNANFTEELKTTWETMMTAYGMMHASYRTRSFASILPALFSTMLRRFSRDSRHIAPMTTAF